MLDLAPPSLQPSNPVLWENPRMVLSGLVGYSILGLLLISKEVQLGNPILGSNLGGKGKTKVRGIEAREFSHAFSGI